MMQRPELIPARLLAALVTPEFHRGEGFSRLFLDSPWSSGRLLTLLATIPAIPQVLHLRISLHIHLHRSQHWFSASAYPSLACGFEPGIRSQRS